MLGEYEEKINADLRSQIQAKLESLKNKVQDGSIADIKESMEELQQVVQQAGASIYQQTADQQAAGPQTPPPGSQQEEQDKRTVDADYKVVDDEEKG
jgi:uncharacterized protein YoxC